MKALNYKSIGLTALAIAMGILIGWLVFGGNSGQQADPVPPSGETGAETIWTCSMHPQIRQSEPGNCPICGMELIPLETESQNENPLSIRMSPSAMQLAGVVTALVGTGNAERAIHLNGKVQADERLVFTQSTHIPGRIEKLKVNFTGEYIKAGQTIAMVFSPELLNAQDELLEAQKFRESQPGLFNAAREKLRNWKLTEQQIDGILSSGKPINQFPVLANVSGFVTKKMVNTGDYIKAGQPIYEIADLSRVWVLFDIYESDMGWVKRGSKVSYTIESIPGETFSGTISYIDPVIDPRTRVAQARLEASNTQSRLKPEMYVSGTLQSQIKGQSMTVPRTAVMWTGKRSLVYVKEANAQGISFMMREIVLGPALGEEFVVESGLQAGEEIAVNGTFSIDAAAQLAGKPSMMNPSGGTSPTGQDPSVSNGEVTKVPSEMPEAAKKAIRPALGHYWEWKDALARDNEKAAVVAATKMKKALSSVDAKSFSGASAANWARFSGNAKEALQHVAHWKDIEAVRSGFKSVSTALIAYSMIENPFENPVFQVHCPMANENKGADWLSRESEVINPYFGASMLKCGEVVKKIK